MNISSTHEGMDVWLQQATYGLPRDVQQRIREEIEDHYLSSLSSYQGRGKSEMQARQDALADLGDFRDAHRAFRDAHGSKWLYLLAGVLSMTMPLILVVVLLAEPEYLFGYGSVSSTLIGLWYLLMSLPIVLPVLYVIYCGHSLLKYRFCFTLGRWRIIPFVAGLLIFFLPEFLNGLWLIATQNPVFTDFYVVGTPALQQRIGFAGLLLISVSLLSISYRLRELPYSFYGMRAALVISASLWGVGQVSMALLNMFPDMATSNTQIIPLAVVFSLVVFCICLGWMFVKAAFMGKVPWSMRAADKIGTAAR